MILQGEIVLTNVNDGINGKDGTNGKDGVNPMFYRLVQNGDGICNASLTTDSNNKLQVQISVNVGFFVYQYQGESAERLQDLSGFNVVANLYDAETPVTVSKSNGIFSLTYSNTLSGDDIEKVLRGYATLNVMLRNTNNKIWDSVTIPVTLDNGNYYARTQKMMESIYTNQTGLSVIKHQADSISAMVYAHGTNMLYDAGFTDTTPNLDGTMGQRRFQTSAGNTVTVNGDGTLTITAAGNTTAQYTGVYWYVPVQATGYYTASGAVLEGTTVTDGSFAIYTATADRTQEQNMIGYNAIKTSDAGKRVSVTTNIELTGADLTKYLEVYVAAPTNGTIKIKCPQLERGKEATNWTLRGTEDGLVKAGVDIEAGKVTQYGDRFLWMDATGKNVIAGMDSDGNATFNGIVHAKGGEFTGKVTAESGKFAGEIEAQGGKITGDIDVQGTLNGGTIKSATLEAPVLKWGENSSMQLNNGWLEFKGDLLSNYTFRLGDAYVRGWFGAYQRVTLVVNGGEATLYYGNSAKPAMATFQLNTAYYNGITYYQIPCYIANLYVSADVNVAGIPVDTVMLQDKANGSNYNYMLDMKSFQKATVITVDNNHKSNYLFRNGGLQRLEGGWYFTVHQVPVDLITPKVASSVPGAGQMWSATYDNNWSS